MIRPGFFVEQLSKAGIDFYAGVPDSLLKNICAYITDHVDRRHNIIAANEGAAIGLAAGHYLATGRAACVYMQNSGEGNAINPLVSLMDGDVYGMPVLLLVGWRGQPGVHDEPQHVKQGKVTLSLLEVIGIEYEVLSKDETEAERQIERAKEALERGERYALVVEKGTFEEYNQDERQNGHALGREEAIGIVASMVGERDVVVSTTGMISRELFEYREAKGEGHERDFLTVGSMGHASQIALGIALEKREGRKVWCFDGDGAAIMHMGSMAVLATTHPTNLVHVVFNNGAHDSVGGQPTVGFDIELTGVAKAMGYDSATRVEDKETLIATLEGMQEGCVFVEVVVSKGNRKDLGRPSTSPKENRDALMKNLNEG